MMDLNNIIFCAENYYSMIYVCTKKMNDKNVVIFTVNQKSLINNFIQYFSPYKAQRLYDSHNENELYGLILE